MTPTDKQLAANRRNSQHSTGPKSQDGKRNSSRNATRHGLFAVAHASEAHLKFTSAIIAHLVPANALERQIAELIAEDHHRLNRIREIETGIFNQGDASAIFLQHAKQLERLTLYESRISRNLQRNLAQLKALQTQRKAERDQQMDEARLLAQVNLSQGLHYHPDHDGFVFSSAEVNAAIDRDNRLQTARGHLATAA